MFFIICVIVISYKYNITLRYTLKQTYSTQDVNCQQLTVFRLRKSESIFNVKYFKKTET